MKKYKKNLICIVGRTSSGKDYIAKRLSTIFDIPQVVSHTTRPKRDNETDGIEHYFDSKEKFQNVLDNQKVIAYTKIGDYEYCATVDDIKQDSIYIIDYDGLMKLKQRYHQYFNLVVVYVYCDEDIRKERASGRSDFETEWAKRNKAEDEQFTRLEMNRDYDIIIDNSEPLDFSKIRDKIRKAMSRYERVY